MRLDHVWRVPFPRLETSFSQGGGWKARITTYIGMIPLSGDVRSAAAQITSERPERPSAAPWLQRSAWRDRGAF